jgi:microcystin-dependent protein
MSIHFLIKWKQVHDVPPVLPGMVVFFAGPITDDPLQRQGWLPCDGRAYDPLGPFKPLFDTIANRYGGTSTGQLCVPDYQGVFLRGVDLGRGKDPDRLVRLPPRPDLPDSGNGGDNPGSWQAHQIGSHTHPYTWQNYNYTTSTVDYCDDFLWQTGREWTSGPAGGCGETRPRNKSLHHLVSWSATPPEPAVPPGTVIAYAGLPSSVTDPAWLPCDGRVLDQQAYPALFNAVGRAHGGDATTFRLPDLRGWFVRGVDCGRLVDTDAAERLAPAPGGNSGDAVGSVQFDDFTSHTHEYYFSTGEQVKATTSGDVPMVIYPGQTQQLTADPGQGQQTRPVNAYVHFLIRVS